MKLYQDIQPWDQRVIDAMFSHGELGVAWLADADFVSDDEFYAWERSDERYDPEKCAAIRHMLAALYLVVSGEQI